MAGEAHFGGGDSLAGSLAGFAGGVVGAVAGGVVGGAPAGAVAAAGGASTGTADGAALGAGANPSVNRSIFWMITGCIGDSCLNGPIAPVGETLMRSTASIPSTTRPNTAKLVRRQWIEIGVVGDVYIDLAIARCGPLARAGPTVPRRFLRPLPDSLGIGFSVDLAL